MAKLPRLVNTGKAFKSSRGYRMMLAASASPKLNNTGMLLLVNIGMLIKMAPTLKKIKKSACNCINGIETDIISGHRQRI
jgi:hypothetical protein